MGCGPRNRLPHQLYCRGTSRPEDPRIWPSPLSPPIRAPSPSPAQRLQLSQPKPLGGEGFRTTHAAGLVAQGSSVPHAPPERKAPTGRLPGAGGIRHVTARVPPSLLPKALGWGDISPNTPLAGKGKRLANERAHDRAPVTSQFRG